MTHFHAVVSAMMLQPGDALLALLCFWLMLVAMAVLVWHGATSGYKLYQNRRKRASEPSPNDFVQPYDCSTLERDFQRQYQRKRELIAQDANENPEINGTVDYRGVYRPLADLRDHRTPGGLWLSDQECDYRDSAEYKSTFSE